MPKIFVFAFIPAVLFFNTLIFDNFNAWAADQTQCSSDQGWCLEVALPGLPSGQPIKEPGQYIRQIYLLGVGVAGVLAVLIIVYAGFQWMTSPTVGTIENAKQMMTGAISGIILLLASYLILYTINPDLISLKMPKLEKLQLDRGDVKVNMFSVPGGANEGGGQRATQFSGSKNCPEITQAGHPCSVENLKKYFGNNAVYASRICSAESAGNPAISNQTAYGMCGGQSIVYGLFQINLGVHSLAGLNCPSAIRDYNNLERCRVINQNLYNQCVAAAKNSETNIRKTVELSDSGNNWKAWSSAIISYEKGGQQGAGVCYGQVPIR